MRDYDFIGVDEGRQNLFRGNTDGTIRWIRPLKTHPIARALQRLSDDTVLVGYQNGYFLINPDSGNIVHSCDTFDGVTSAYREDDGATLLTGAGPGPGDGVWTCILDADDRVTKTVRRRGNYVRLMRPTPEGTWLHCMNNKILETDRSMKSLRRFKTRGFLHAWKAERLEDGTTLVSGGYGAFMALFDSRGKLIRRFGDGDSVPEEVNPNFYASFERDAEGNILLANWQGHGPDQGTLGRQLLKFSPEGEYLESWSFPDDVSSLQGLLLI